MDIQSTKLDLINWLSSLTDETLISKLYSIKSNSTNDWYDDLTISDKKAIQKSIAQADAGETIPHNEVMAKARLKIQQLKNS